MSAAVSAAEAWPRVLMREPAAPVPSRVLLPRIAAGDEAAVNDCLAEYGGMVWSLARRWSTDDGDAEDAVQEVFYDLWKCADRYDAAKASERGFVAMIARRRLIDRARKRRKEAGTEPLPDGFDLAADAPDESDRVAAGMDAQAALAELSPIQRQLIERHLLDGKTHDELAQETRLPLGTVKSHIRRGLLKARALLQGRRAGENDA